jgi:hypothetical protein
VLPACVYRSASLFNLSSVRRCLQSEIAHSYWHVPELCCSDSTCTTGSRALR